MAVPPSPRVPGRCEVIPSQILICLSCKKSSQAYGIPRSFLPEVVLICHILRRQ